MLRTILITCVLLPILTACGSNSNSINSASQMSATLPTAPPELPTLIVHKSEGCSCCELWVKHMHDAGFKVDVHDEDNLASTKERVGIPIGKGSCHTAEVGGYFVEGHVPAEDVKRLLAEHPNAKGLTVPGMPAGSPGMELPSGNVQPYDVLIVAEDGTTSVYAHHDDKSPH